MTIPELVGLKGGKKQVFIREHRDEILTYLARNGAEATMREYKLTANTLMKVQRENRRPDLPNNGDRAMDLAQLANERSLEVQRTVNELKEAYSKFPELVSQSLADNFFKPLLRHIRIPPELESKPDNRLSLADVEEPKKLD